MPAVLANFVIELVDECPWLYLDEISSAVNEESCLHYGRDCKQYSRNYVHSVLIQSGYTLKKMRAKAAERDEANRDLYWRAVVTECTSRNQLIFGDETALNGRALRRKCGWGGLGRPE